VSVTSPEHVDALDAVRAALLADAERDAARLLALADAEVEAVRRRTSEECDRIRREARARGEADAQETLAAERARARRRSRSIVLRARGEVYEELRRRVREAAVALRETADYPALHARLVEEARAAVGADARLSETPDGVVAEAHGLRAALSLTAVAEDVLDRMGPDPERLWSP
jgi:V/A-type H+-transporting ATPase subunit E